MLMLGISALSLLSTPALVTVAQRVGGRGDGQLHSPGSGGRLRAPSERVVRMPSCMPNALVRAGLHALPCLPLDLLLASLTAKITLHMLQDKLGTSLSA